MSKQEFYKIKQPQPQKKPDTEKIQDWVWKDNKTKKYQRPKLKPTTYMRGLQISVKGRLKGARRARAMTEGHGSVGPNSYKIRSRSNQQTIFTKWGTWSLKTSLSRVKW